MSLYAVGDTILGFVAYHVAATGSLKSGLAPTYSVTLDGGSTVIASGTASEKGTTGIYYATVAGALITVAGNYTIKFSVVDATLMFQDLVALVQVSGRIGYLDAAISTRATPADIPNAAAIAADVQTGLTAQGYTAALAPNLANADVPTSTRSTLTAAQVTAAVPTIAAIADQVSEELTADHSPVAGSNAENWLKAASYSAAAVTVTSPVATNSNVTIIRGDSYDITDAAGREIAWTDSGNTWPTLTAATIAVFIDGEPASYAGTVVVATGVGKKVRLTLTAAQTAAMTIAGPHAYDVQATLSNTHIITLVQGNWTVLEDVTL